MDVLISAEQLKQQWAAPDAAQRWVVLDCGFDLFDSQAGERAYGQGHLPNAHYLHLERDLSGPKQPPGPNSGGRHPLPAAEAWAQIVGELGIGPETSVVVYDEQGGPYAARAWWMLRWIGHDRVVVLDGGKQAWVASGGELSQQAAQRHSGAAAYQVRAQAASMPTIDAHTLLQNLGRVALFDARAGERFRGETEPLDSRAGHIPGAINRFFKDNLQADGRFKPADQLRQEWSRWLEDATQSVHQCGSGVTACHNLLALAHAGLGVGRLYPGSWSEWSADPDRPCATGA